MMASCCSTSGARVSITPSEQDRALPVKQLGTFTGKSELVEPAGTGRTGEALTNWSLSLPVSLGLTQAAGS